MSRTHLTQSKLTVTDELIIGPHASVKQQRKNGNLSAVDIHGVFDGISAMRTSTPVNGETYYLNYHTAELDGSAGLFVGITGASAGTYTDDGTMIIVPSDGNGSACYRRVTAPGEYVIHQHCTVANIESVCALITADANASNVVTFMPGSYTIDSTVDFSAPEDTTIHAYGAAFTCTANSLAFDLNPECTAEIPITDTTDTYTKRRIRWYGGYFTNSNATKTASICFQAYFMRDCEIKPEYIENFYCGVKFGGKDSYDLDGFIFGCERSYWVPDGGVIHTESLTGNDLLNVKIGGHISCSGKEHAIFIDNRVVGLYITASINGATTDSHVKLSDSASAAGRDYNFYGMHIEQIAASQYAVEFNAAGGNGFLNINFDGASELVSSTEGWKGVKLDKCWYVRFASMYFVDGSGGSTEEGIYVDDDSRDIVIDTETVQFATFAAGQAIVLETATNRQYIRLLPEIDVISPVLLANYNADSFSTTTATIDMSTEFTGFANYLLPPKGYTLQCTAWDSGSAAGANLKIRIKGSAAEQDNGALQVWLSGVPNDERRSSQGIVKADSNGDVYTALTASGTDTMDVWIAVVAVHQ